MTFSLYTALVPSELQILRATLALLEKAETFCAENGVLSEMLIGARFADDMFPFATQVFLTTVHSLGAIEGVRVGTFTPDTSSPPSDFDGLKTRVAATIQALEAIEPAEVDSFVGRDLIFQFRDFRQEYVTEEFLLSFSQPNFYFHATTAYDLLRWKGMPLVKRDFSGNRRFKV